MTYSSMGKKESDFFQKCLSELWKYGIDVTLIGDTQKSGTSGWFDADVKELVVTARNPHFFEVFLHEYNHFQQWKTANDIWSGHEPYFSDFWEILAKEKPVTPKIKKKLTKCALRILEVEIDCEKRTVAMIKKNKFDIDINEYRRASNAYFWCYGFVVDIGSWMKKPIYQTKGIVNHMDTVYLNPEDYLKIDQLSAKVRKMFRDKF